MELENKGEHFEKLVELPLSKEKIFYKVHYPATAPLEYLTYEEIQPMYRAQIDLF